LYTRLIRHCKPHFMGWSNLRTVEIACPTWSSGPVWQDYPGRLLHSR